MALNAGGVTITTMKLKIYRKDCQHINLECFGPVQHTQFAVVDIALAGALIARGVISAGYNQVIPSQPTDRRAKGSATV